MPLLFASGMSLIDTLDGILMLYAYSWASIDKKRRIFFNLYLTLVSAFIAIVVATIEILGLFSSEFNLKYGHFWSIINIINEHFEYVGYAILIFFGLSMITATITFKYCIATNNETSDNNNRNNNNNNNWSNQSNSLHTSENTNNLILEETKISANAQIRRKKEADYLRNRMLQMARGNVEAIDICN